MAKRISVAVAWLLAVVWALSGWTAVRAKAEDEVCDHPRYVVLRADAAFDGVLLGEVRKDLAAELSLRGFGVCAEPAVDGELAAEIVLQPLDAAGLAIQVDDHTTGKTLSRTLSFARIPHGGRALAIAIAADELLRASWAELMLRRAQTPQETELDPQDYQNVPKRSAATPLRVTRVRQAPAEPRLSLGAMVAYTSSSLHWSALSLEAQGQARLFGWSWLAVGFGGELALPKESANGRGAARGLHTSLSLGACYERVRLWSACGGARSTLHWTQFRGSDARSESAKAARGGAISLVVAGVGLVTLRVTERLWVGGELSLGGAALGSRAIDANHKTVLGIDGMVGALGLGAGWLL